MAIEYITSKNLFLLICDTLKLMDENLMLHGQKVGYIMSKMLECSGEYEKYEIADFMILAALHDIGAYKTDDVHKQLTFDAKAPMPHSIYGYLFLKYLSPLEDKSKMILYHHVDTEKIKGTDFPFKKEAEILKIAEIMDIWMKAFGLKFDYMLIERYREVKFSKDAIDLLNMTVEKYDIFTKLQNGKYIEEYEEMLEYVLLSDNEKEKYLRMLMYCTGLKDEALVSNAISTICVCRELGRMLRITEADKNEIYYAALLHDIGMIKMPKELLDAPRKLREEEVNFIHGHVACAEEILKGKLSDSIISIVTAHHERFDGSGYPKGLSLKNLNSKQAILQIAEIVVNMSNDKPYRKAYSKEEIITELNSGIVSGKYEGIVTDTFLKHYDEIMNIAMEKAKSVMVTHQKLRLSYDQIQKSFAS